MAEQSHDEGRLERMEGKLDKMADALVLLARIDERLVTQTERAEWQGRRQEAIENRVAALELSRAKFMGAVMVVSAIGSFVWPLIKKVIGLSE